MLEIRKVRRNPIHPEQRERAADPASVVHIVSHVSRQGRMDGKGCTGQKSNNRKEVLSFGKAKSKHHIPPHLQAMRW